RSVIFSVSYDMLSRLPAAVPRRGHGPAPEPAAQAFALGCVRADPEIKRAGAKPSDVEPRAVSALAQSASRFAAPTASRPELRCQLEKLGSSRLPVCLARLTGECSWQTNIGNDVGVEPTTLRLTI